ncbi:TPA: NAD(P)H-dependent oxidoreductase [Campylobacter jejuni]|nr:NAD(P)H-dependent oxidoreductase [Campylobacter jejuni]HEF8715157.1 NAD(P)H-dependent oxidoreductase [Campylobacter jejuni]
MKTLIIFAHTFWEDSKVNKALFESIKNSNLGGAQESYDGHHGATLEELLKPICYTFEYLGCKSLKPFAIFSADANKLDLKAYQDAISQNSGCS